MPIDALTFFELCLFVEASANSLKKLLKKLGIEGVRKGGSLLFSRAEADRVKAAWQARKLATADAFESDSSA